MLEPNSLFRGPAGHTLDRNMASMYYPIYLTPILSMRASFKRASSTRKKVVSCRSTPVKLFMAHMSLAAMTLQIVGGSFLAALPTTLVYAEDSVDESSA